MEPEDVAFPSAGGTCRGVIYRPDGAGSDPLPAVALAHGVSGTRLTQYDARARRLAESGAAVLDFDPRYIGTSPGEPRQRINAFDWLADLSSAVAYLRSRSDVDGESVGLYGSSLGGGLAVAVAAEDPSIRAIAIDVPSLDGLRATTLPVRARPALGAAAIRDAVGRRRGRPPLHVPVFGGPESGAVVQSDVEGFWKAMDELEDVEWLEPGKVVRHPQTGEWRNEATAYELLSLLRFRPRRRVTAVRCPILAHLARDDRAVPYRFTRKSLSRAADVEIRDIRGGHFAPFYGDGFETTVTAQIEFFGRRLRGARDARSAR